MKILLISDTELSKLNEHINIKAYADIDLILSAGDLPSNYLSFITTILRKPLLYVHGNHDYKYDEHPPMGCICIEDIVYNFEGIRIAGLGGCMEYRGGLHQYTEKEMVKRVRKMKKQLKSGFDILLTHSPAYQIGDGLDRAHIGFQVFRDLIQKYQPHYMCHGHQHLNYGNNQRIHHLNETQIINAYGSYTIEI